MYALTNQKCVKLVEYDENQKFLVEISKKLFGNINIGNIWVMPNVDTFFVQAQNENATQLFEYSELYQLLSIIFDKSEVLAMWYSNDYHDLENVATKEQFFDVIKDSINDSMCECYLYYTRNEQI